MTTHLPPRSSSPVAQLKRLAGTLSIKQAIGLYLDEWVSAFLRVVPGLIGIGLRWAYYKCFFTSLRGFSFIGPGARIQYPGGVSIGRNLHLNSGTFVDGRGTLTLGDNVLIGPNVVLLSSQHHWTDAEVPIVLQGNVLAPTTIGDDVWIGANAVILPGVTVATGTVVGACAVVSSDTEPYSIVGGIPARQIGSRPAPADFPGSPGEDAE